MNGYVDNREFNEHKIKDETPDFYHDREVRPELEREKMKPKITILEGAKREKL